MAARYKELTLRQYLETCTNQQAAADALGCTQGNISQALKDIDAGLKTVVVRVFSNGTVEADIVKPFGSRKNAKAA